MSWNRKVVLIGPLPPPYPERLLEEFPGLRIADCSAARSHVAEEIADAQIAFGRVKPEEFERAKALEFIQADTQGVERFMYPALRESTVRIANVGDLYSPAIAEHVLAMVLALYRRLPDFVRWQQARHWARPVEGMKLLRGQAVGFVGTGSIARHAAELFRCFGCRTLGYSRSGRRHPAFDEVFRGLPALLEASEIVVASLPYTAETERLLDAEAFRHVRPGSVFVNVGRGKTVDEAALVEALRDGRLGGAGLDVFEQEPLPEDSPLWAMENVVVTSHHSAGGLDYLQGLYRLFAENLRRLRDGRPLLNLVDKARGY